MNVKMIILRRALMVHQKQDSLKRLATQQGYCHFPAAASQRAYVLESTRTASARRSLGASTAVL
jgi:hypothetical protein